MSNINALDCSTEISTPPGPKPHSKAWIKEDISTEDWLFKIDDQALAELDQLANALEPQANPIQLDIGNYHLPRCKALFAEIKRALDDGIGFAVADRLPVDKYQPEILVQLFYILGTFIGRPVAQKHNGEMIYSVKDTGRALPVSYTHLTLPTILLV